MSYLTEQDVRAFIVDRTIADNDGLGLAFKPEDIAEAMKRAAREYNSVPPLIGQVTGTTLPDDTNMFLDATAQQLYLAELANLTRKDIDYTAGGVQTPIERQRIEHLKKLIDLHGTRFTQAASTFKRTLNFRRAYRHIH